MDREGANFSFAVSTLQAKLGVKAIPLQLPIFKSDIFCGVIDVVGMKSIQWDNNPTSATLKLLLHLMTPTVKLWPKKPNWWKV